MFGFLCLLGTARSTTQSRSNLSQRVRPRNPSSVQNVRAILPLPPMLLLLDVRVNFLCRVAGVRLLLCALQLVIISCLSCVWEENSYLPSASLPAGRRLRQGICQVREKRGVCEAVGVKKKIPY